MQVEALSTLPWGAIDVERQRRESSGKRIVRAEEGTTPAMKAGRMDNTMPKAGAIDIARFPGSANEAKDFQEVCRIQADFLQPPAFNSRMITLARCVHSSGMIQLGLRQLGSPSFG